MYTSPDGKVIYGAQFGKPREEVFEEPSENPDRGRATSPAKRHEFDPGPLTENEFLMFFRGIFGDTEAPWR